MKKTILLLASCIIGAGILFTGCSGKQQNESNVHSRNNVSFQDNKIEQATMDSEDTIFLVDKVVFEDGIISLKCKEIYIIILYLKQLISRNMMWSGCNLILA